MDQDRAPYQKLTPLERPSTFYRRRIFLHFFLIGLIILHLIGLLAMLFIGTRWHDFGIFALLQLLYFTSLFLNRRGKTVLASFLTCYTFNGEFFYYFIDNLFQMYPISNSEAALIMAFLMGLSSLLAGMLMSQQAIISFTALNGLLIAGAIFQVHDTLSSALVLIVPLVGLTCLVGLISWLYQNSLLKVDHQLELTRQELMTSQQQKAIELEELVKERTAELSHTLQNLKETQKELKQAKEEAEDASQAKSDFLSSMSHEFRTPLNGILGYAQLLKQKPNLDALDRQGLDMINQSGDHLLSMINDILDISKVEARKITLQPTEIHLATFLESVVSMMRLAASQKQVQLRYEPDNSLPIGVLADEKRLRQVVINLLGNAIKFTNQGEVRLKVSCPTTLNDNSHFLRFEIIDTGIGMTASQLKKIFLPFEQVGKPRQRAKGTGLGLAITRQLVALMGGEVQVESQVGEGSRFWFDVALPVSVEREEKPPDALNASSWLAPPQEELAQLHKLASQGMISHIRQWADDIEARDASLHPFAAKVRQLARSFEDEAILELACDYLTPEAMAS